MRLFITGISGLLGLNAATQLRDHVEASGCYLSHQIRLEGVRTSRIDVTSYHELRDTLEIIRPDVILHTAGLTTVDGCEEDPEQAKWLNTRSTENVARLAGLIGARLVHVSTDHLFDGTRPFAKEETEPFPLNVYAKTKWEAEQVVQRHLSGALIIRTNFFGWGPPYRKSFSDWIRDALITKRELKMFSDVFFTPILVNDLIDIVLSLLDLGATGIYNVVGRERLSKYSFAFRLAQVFDYTPDGIRPVSIDDSGIAARRPKDMSLSCQKVTELLGRPMPGVADGLHRLKALYKQGWNLTLVEAVQKSVEPEALRVAQKRR